MLDSMGIYQHHDAVTGTAKQYVANDYTLRHIRAIRNNSDQYGKMINKLSFRTAGLSSPYWSQCTVNNGTYLDCPVSNHINETFVVAI
jgi:Alpha mannosidase middle domain